MFLLGIIGGSLLTYGILKANRVSKTNSIHNILKKFYGETTPGQHKHVAENIAKKVL